MVEAVSRTAPDIVALSARLRTGVKVIVGGAPVTRQYADRIGAEGYSDNAFGAVRLARALLMKEPAR